MQVWDQVWDSNPQSSERESHPITTKSEMKAIFISSYKFCFVFESKSIVCSVQA